MNPGRLDFAGKTACPQGATFGRTLTYKVNGNAVDLSGYSARMQVREDYSSDTKLVDLTTGNGITLGGAAGTVVFTLTATQTAALPAGSWVYDLELVSAGGQVTRLVEGKFVVSPEVTR